jgi:hypothetical protein
MQERTDLKEQPLTRTRKHSVATLHREIKGSAPDTEQIQQMVEKNIFPAKVDNNETDSHFRDLWLCLCRKRYCKDGQSLKEGHTI